MTQPLFWQAVMFIAGLAANMWFYLSVVNENKEAEKKRTKDNLLADGENSYKFECMWADYKRSHSIHTKNGDDH